MPSRLYGVAITATWTCYDCEEEFDVDYDNLEAFSREQVNGGPNHDDHGYCEPPDDDDCSCTGNCDPESCSCCSDSNCECCQDDDDDDDDEPEPEDYEAEEAAADSTYGQPVGTSSVYGTLR